MTARRLVPATLVALALLGACAKDPDAALRRKIGDVHLATAEAALASGDYARAQVAADVAASYDPLRVAARDLQNRVRLTALVAGVDTGAANRPVELDYAAETMLARDPAHAYVYEAARGVLALARHDDAAADKHLRASVAARKDWAPALAVLGKVLVEEGQAAAGAAQLQQALAVDPGNRAALLLLGRALLEAGDPDRAVVFLEGAVKLVPSARLRMDLADAYTAKGRTQEAGEQLQAAVALEPNNAEVVLRLGQWAFLSGRLDLAERAYRQAELLGAQPGATAGLAVLRSRQKQWAAAVALYAKALPSMLQNAPFLYEAAVAYEEAGDLTTATVLLDRYLALALHDQREGSRISDATARRQRLEQAAAKGAHK